MTRTKETVEALVEKVEKLEKRVAALEKGAAPKAEKKPKTTTKGA